MGSTFGTGANAPHDCDEGWESLVEVDLTLRRLYTFGLFLQPWQTAPYVKNPAVGRFEGTVFDAAGWKPRVPTAAFLRARGDDTFWAARRVMAFSDGMIRAIVRTGRYTDPQAEQLLADVLIQRRDKIGRAYLNAINPIVNVALDDGGTLTFDNGAVTTGVGAAPAGGYVIQWMRFDNNTATTTPVGTSTATATPTSRAPEPLPSEPGAYLKLEIRGGSRQIHPGEFPSTCTSDGLLAGSRWDSSECRSRDFPASRLCLAARGCAPANQPRRGQRQRSCIARPKSAGRSAARALT